MPFALLGEKDWLRNFVPFNDRIYYVFQGWNELRTSEIRSYDLANGRNQTLLSLEGLTSLGFSVSPDRRTFLVTRRGGSGNDLMLIDHFR